MAGRPGVGAASEAVSLICGKTKSYLAAWASAWWDASEPSPSVAAGLARSSRRRVWPFSSRSSAHLVLALRFVAPFCEAVFSSCWIFSSCFFGRRARFAVTAYDRWK